MHVLFCQKVLRSENLPNVKHLRALRPFRWPCSIADEPIHLINETFGFLLDNLRLRDRRACFAADPFHDGCSNLLLELQLQGQFMLLCTASDEDEICHPHCYSKWTTGSDNFGKEG